MDNEPGEKASGSGISGALSGGSMHHQHNHHGMGKRIHSFIKH